MIINGIETRQYLLDQLDVLNTGSQTDGSSAASSVGSFLSGASSTATQDSTTTTQADFSQAASQMSILAQLQNQSPEAFKALAKSISEDLSSAAGESGDPQQKIMLKTIAGQFSNAATTGSMSSLVPSSKGGNTLRGYGSQKISLFSSTMAQGQGADVFNQVGGVIKSNLASLAG